MVGNGGKTRVQTELTTQSKNKLQVAVDECRCHHKINAMKTYKLTATELCPYNNKNFEPLSLDDARETVLAGRNVAIITDDETAKAIWEAMPTTVFRTRNQLGCGFNGLCLSNGHKTAQHGWYAKKENNESYVYHGIRIGGVMVNKATGIANETAIKRVNAIFDTLEANKQFELQK